VLAREEALRDANPAIDQVLASVRTCFAKLTVSRGDLRVTVSTHLSLLVTPSGTIGETQFDPPLVPAVQSCVSSATEGIVFPRSTAGFDVERVLELEH
jgi:hypothetical protein